MAVICGPITDTIGYGFKNICNHLVKIYDIKPYYDTIDIQIDNQIIPGVGNVAVGLGPTYEYRAVISLISKNINTGTATISFSIETIEVPPPTEEVTHNLDIYIKPYSWYTQGGTADWIVGKLGDINGTLINIFSGLTGYQYLGTEVLTEIDRPYTVTVRVKVKQLSLMSMAAFSIAPIIIAIAVIILIVGIIVAYRFYQWSGALVEGKQYSKRDVEGIVYDNVIPKQMEECEKNYTDPIQQTNCKKSVICGAADGITDALSLTGTDCQTLKINEKVDACTTQYNIDHDLTKYKACVIGIAKDAGTETKAKTPKEGADILTLLLYGGFILGGLYIITKPAEKIIPAIYETERKRRG